MSLIEKLVIYLKMCRKVIIKKPSPGNIAGIFKYVYAWFKYNSSHNNPLSEQIPWLNFAAINKLKKICTPEKKLFEYGSGGSTLFFSGRLNYVVSIEHDREWYEKTVATIKKSGINNVDYFLIEPEPDSSYGNKDPEKPENYLSTDEHYKGKNFRSYVNKILDYPDNYFDIIIIDGRARPSCIAAAISKLKPQGHLVIDNTERKYYLSFFNFDKKKWEKISYFGPVPFNYSFCETTILKKKKEI